LENLDIQGDSKLLSGFPLAYNFQTGNNKIKLLTEYEDVTQKVLFGNAVLAILLGAGLDVMDQFRGLRAHPMLAA
jgi:hypothetical protein